MFHAGDDTIVAVSTAPGQSALAVIRLSGPASRGIGHLLLRRPSGAAVDLEPRVARHCVLGHPGTGDPVDDVMAVCYAGPASFTGEDMLEVTCHGGTVTSALALDLFLAAGARLAEPGEFSMRAYLAGKLDLSAAEGILDQIEARTPAAQRMALRQREGMVSAAVEALRSEALSLLSHLQASIDFPDEVDEPDRTGLAAGLEMLLLRVQALQDTYAALRPYRDGVRVALVGPPNAGKSSLLNALVGHGRSIVSPAPGTTRDTVETGLLIGGVQVTLVDTAGIHAATDPIEVQGVGRSLAEVDRADIRVVVLDASCPPDPDWLELAGLSVRQRLVCALNKVDLLDAVHLAGSLSAVRAMVAGIVVVPVSALTGAGVADLLPALQGEWHEGDIDPGAAVITSARHADALARARAALASAAEALRRPLPADAVCVTLAEACQALGEVAGGTADDDLVRRIFSSFCVGK